MLLHEVGNPKEGINLILHGKNEHCTNNILALHIAKLYVVSVATSV